VSEAVAVNDAGGYGVAIENCSVAAGQEYWKVTSVHHLTPDENQGNHNIYVNVYDAEGDPFRDVTVLMFWDDGEAQIPLEKQWPSDTEMAMGNGVLGKNAISIKVDDADRPSDVVSGLMTAFHGDEFRENGEVGNSWGHHSFLVEFRPGLGPGSGDDGGGSGDDGSSEPEQISWEVASALITAQSEDEIVVEVRLQPA